MTVVPISALSTFLFHVDGAFWSSSIIGLYLLQAKSAKCFVSHREVAKTNLYVYQSQKRVLIGERMGLTVILGTLCLMLWLAVTKLLIAPFPHLVFGDYRTALGFLVGLFLHLN
jgi:hypothetical protein